MLCFPAFVLSLTFLFGARAEVSKERSCLTAKVWLQSAYYGEGALVDALLRISQLPQEINAELAHIKHQRQFELQNGHGDPLRHLFDVYHIVNRILNFERRITIPAVLFCCSAMNEHDNEDRPSCCRDILALMLDTDERVGCSITVDDLEVLNHAMLRALTFYPSSPEDLLQGRLSSGPRAIHPLTVQDLQNLQVAAYRRGHFHACLQLHLTNMENLNRLMEIVRQACLEGTKLIHGKSEEEKFPAIMWIHYLYLWLEPQLPTEWTEEAVRSLWIHADTSPNYIPLCRMNKVVRPLLQACFYHRPRGGWYRVKTELLNKTPRVYRFLDVIHGIEIREMKLMTMGNMEISGLYKDDDVELYHTIRLSGTTWLYDDPENEEMADFSRELSQRISLITGLELKHRNDSEAFQVVNYGVAGHYEEHLDALFNDSSDGHGNPEERMATWMFYLSKPKMGGNTVFPKLDLAATPIRGSAIFWYNVYPNGSVNTNSRHGACPVLAGNKWITTKWVKVGGQWKTRQCPLDRFAVDFSGVGKI